MKNIKQFLFLLAIVSTVLSCKENVKEPLGKPDLKVTINDEIKHLFGDSLQFMAETSDEGVSLSTLKVQLFFDEEKVSEEVIRTKEYGTYEGKIYIPFLENIPDGTAKLKFVLQNVSLTKKEKTVDLPLERPDFPYLNLIIDNESYTMQKVGDFEYEITDEFPLKIGAYIETPAFGENQSKINFGWTDNKVAIEGAEPIPFSNVTAGNYTIKFNTQNFSASPFLIGYSVNGQSLDRVNDDFYEKDIELKKDEEIEIEGIEDIEEWWIDPDYFLKNDEEGYAFNAMNGKYRLNFDFDKRYLSAEVMSGNHLAELNNDGTGAVWIIGEGVGKPSLNNEVGWDTDKAFCMAPVTEKVYRLTVVADQQINVEDINFKFFHQKGWGGEFTNSELDTDSEIVYIGDGDNDRDPGNLGLYEGKSFEAGATYEFILDLTEGRENGKLKINKIK